VRVWADKYEAKRGRKPTQRVLAQMRQQAALATREAKPKDRDASKSWAVFSLAGGLIAGEAGWDFGRCGGSRL
jgi:hypothetical protein